jgi:hypothetical protein
MTVHLAVDPTPSTDTPCFAALGEDLAVRLRSFGVNLNLVWCQAGVVLEGQSPTFFGKQMAQELARKANLIVHSNRIVVERGITDPGTACRVL